MNYLQKTLMIVLLSTLGMLIFVSNSWAPIIINPKQDNKKNTQRPLANETDITICYNATDTFGSQVIWKNQNEDFVGEAKFRNLNCDVNNDILGVLQILSLTPREHFLKGMEFVKKNKINMKDVGKAFKLELELLAERKHKKFATKTEDVANVLEIVDFSIIDKRKLKLFYSWYQQSLSSIDVLNTDSIANNMKVIPTLLANEETKNPKEDNDLKEQLELERADISDKSDELERLEVLKLMDELELKEKNAEIQKDKLRELERKLLALENKQKQEQQKIDTDTLLPLLEITSNITKDKRGTINGYVSDNIKVAELSVDGKSIFFAPDGNFTFSTYVPPSGKKLEIQVTDMSGLTTLKIVTLNADRASIDTSISFDSLNPLGKKVKPNPNALALIVGISSYENTKAKAIYADKDAIVFKDYATEKLFIFKKSSSNSLSKA
jgi:hypothetical protein